MKDRLSNDDGVALVAALIFTSFFATLGLGLAFAVSVDRMTDRNHAAQARGLYAAEAALELAAAEIGGMGDFDAVLNGLSASAWTDGAAGVRTLPGSGAIDLGALTNQLSCGRTAACSDAQIAVATAERPWEANNARWRLFLHLPLADVVGETGASAYIVVWIGDDAAEIDGDPLRDGGENSTGRGVLRARAEAFGRLGARRAVEANFVRVCQGDEGGEEVCLPGIRVQSWQEVRDRLP